MPRVGYVVDNLIEPVHRPVGASSFGAAALAPGSDCTMYECDSVAQWLLPSSYNYRGLLVKRGIDPSRFQLAANQAVTRASNMLERGQTVNIEALRGSPASLRARIAEACQQNMDGLGLPADLMALIIQDATDIGEVMTQLLPDPKVMTVKLEAIGNYGRCGRWHQDAYIARAMVSYNGTGTLYISNDYVDMGEVTRGGPFPTNEHVVKDYSKVRAVGVGDILLIKGDGFPHPINGLVHKAPENPPGKVLERLALKLDIYDKERGSTWCSDPDCKMAH